IDTRFIIFAPWKAGWGKRFVGDGTPSAGVPLLLRGECVGAEDDLAADLLEPLQLVHGEFDFSVKGNAGGVGELARELEERIPGDERVGEEHRGDQQV